MLSQQDLKQIAQKGITEEQIKIQLEEFKTGFPFLKIEAAAGIGQGIIRLDEDARNSYVNEWNTYKKEGHKIVKFVQSQRSESC